MSFSGSSNGSIQDDGQLVHVDAGVLQHQEEQFEEIRQQQIRQNSKSSAMLIQHQVRISQIYRHWYLPIPIP